MGELYEDKSSQIVIVNIITLVMAIAAVILRLISRHLSAAKFWWDDGLIVVGLFLDFGSAAFNFSAARNGAGRHHPIVPEAQQVALAKIIYGIEILYGLLLTAIKSSILMLYLRLFGVRKLFRLSIYVVQTIVICWCIAIVFVSIFQASPIRSLWHPELMNAHHINFTAYLVGLAVPNVTVDFAILVLPVYIIWQLQLSKKRKAALSAIFAVAIFVCVVSIIRTYQVSIVNNSDKEFSYASTLTWSAVEANVGITCACLPLLQPVIQEVTKRAVQTYTVYQRNKSKEVSEESSAQEIFQGGDTTFRKLDDEDPEKPKQVIPANSRWVSAMHSVDSPGSLNGHGERNSFPMNAIHVKSHLKQ
ncbi:MAG: hypothetical protein Q9222_004638 [Ikaeria aurantiellina]